MRFKKFYIIVLTAVGLFLISACGNTAKDSHQGMHSNTESKDDHQHNGGTEGHSHSSGMDNHMDHMNDVRSWLQRELGDKYDADVPVSTHVEVEAGKTVFLKVCQSCHGESGKGDGPAAAGLDPKPADFTDPSHSKFYSDMGRLHIIKKGIKGTVMVGWENILSETEINNVYDYIRSLRNDGTNSVHEEHNHSH